MRSTALHALMLAGLLLAPPVWADSAEQASRFYEDALKRYERNDDAGAIIQLKNALKEDSRMLPALVLLGQAHLRKGEPAAAERVLADAEKIGAAREQIAVYQAQAQMAQGKWRVMLERYGADGLPEAARVDVLLMRARAQLNLGQLDAAMTSAQQAASLPAGRARALAFQARIHLNAGRDAEALATVREALRVAPRDSDALTMLASIHHLRGQLNEAIVEYGKALAAQPRNVDARLARAGLLLDLERTAEARTDLDYLQKNFSHDPRAAYLRALDAERRGDLAASQAALRDAVATLEALSPEFLAASEQLQFLAGLSHHALGEYERALTYLVAYLEKRPRDVAARKLIGSIYLAKRQYDRATAVLQPALRTQPNDARILAMLAEAAMRQGNPGKAASLFKDAAAVRDDAGIQTGLGVSLIGAGQVDAGFQTLARAYNKAPGSTQSAIPYALALLKRGDARESAKVLSGVLKREPNNVPVRNLLGLAKLGAGDRPGARAAYTEAIRAKRNFYPAHLNLARLDEMEGRLAQARERYLGIHKVAPAYMEAILELARLDELRGQPAESLKWLEKAKSVRERDIRPRLALAALYLRLGQSKSALDAAKDAQARAPDNASALLLLARAQLAVGNGDAAKSVLRQVVKVAAFNPALLVQAAKLQIESRDFDAARYSLDKALLGESVYPPAQAMRIRLELEAGNIAEAERRIAQAGAGIGQSEALRLTGEVRMAQRRYDDAINAFKSAYATVPSQDTAFGLYGAYLAAGRPADAATLMESRRQRDPQSRLLAHALGESLMAARDYPRARAIYTELVGKDAKDARAHNNLANTLLQLGDPAALNHAEKARALAPNQPQVNDTLGWVLVSQGQVEKGLRYLREAALRAPNDPEIRRHLEIALEKRR